MLDKSVTINIFAASFSISIKQEENSEIRDFAIPLLKLYLSRFIIAIVNILSPRYPETSMSQEPLNTFFEAFSIKCSNN